MKKILRSVLKLSLALLLVGGSVSCGDDYTGFKVFVYPPQTTSFRFPDDYDHIRVQLEMDNGKTYGETYEPSPTTSKPPFTFIVLAGETEYQKAKSLYVDLLKGTVLIRREMKSDVAIREGELIQQSFTFPQ